MVTINRKRMYNVKIVDKDGNMILTLSGPVLKKIQYKGFAGLSNTVNETLFFEDFDFIFSKIFDAYYVGKSQKGKSTKV
jgi:hypothetical protein